MQQISNEEAALLVAIIISLSRTLAGIKNKGVIPENFDFTLGEEELEAAGSNYLFGVEHDKPGDPFKIVIASTKQSIPSPLISSAIQ